MEIQSYLSQRYPGHESFIENIIIPIFGEDNYETAWDVELLDTVELQNQAARTGIRSILRCGTINLDLTPIEVFDITVADRIMMDKNRVGVQAIIRRVMDTYSGAFMLIHYDNDVKWDWRFTFCQLKDKSEFTDSKRYTFLLGPNQSCRTAAQNFQKLADLHEDITIKDIVAAFDVEALSKAFFDGYKLHYERFVEYITGKRFVKNGGRFEETVTHSPHRVYYPAFRRDDKAVRDYTKLLLARIVFLHFLQKKGWLGVPANGKWGDGDEQFMKHLFERASAAQKDDFLESVLEPLFFDALNGDRAGNKDLFDTKVLGVVRIPYLNGGLFSKDSLDDIVIKYPRDYFGNFLEFLYQYNFTIDENDPNEAQVGIDPEMLGKIFENLLEDNKDKGAFYTPKEIVQYMCQESLVAYLATKTGYDEDKLHSFVKNPDVFVDKFTEDEKYDILDAILKVKVCDPAIGSGAFPIGLLNELVRCKEAIYGDEKDRAEIKKEIIRDNIYGVDIERGAVDIARLRFWLSLIVDEDEPCPLPNLDYKIMQGNSLLEWYNGVDLSHLVDAGDTDVFLSGASDLKDDLTKSLKEYFGETNQAKKKVLKAHISETIKKILEVAAVELPEDIDIAENSHFFLWHTWYNEVFAEGGFDIVIGNPPYLESRSPEFPDKLKTNLQLMLQQNRGSDARAFPRGADLLIYFYELALRLINQKGYNVFITENAWLSTDYGKLFQDFLRNKCVVHAIIDSDFKYFETADINTVITFFQNKHNYLSVYPVSFFHCHGSLSDYPCNTFAAGSCANITKREFPSDDILLVTNKWSVVFNADEKLLHILKTLFEQQSNDLARRLSVGQGLNISKSNILYEQKRGSVPYYTSDAGATYSWEDSTCYVLSKVASSNRQKPQLILPRGLGTHFCSVNNCGGFTSSYVEIYGDMTDEEKHSIWLFCNSSLLWLFREITGRTNLGGGMLKAEATDLRSIPIAFIFEPKITEEIFNKLKGKHLSSDLKTTLSSSEHKELDKFVLQQLGLQDEEDFIVQSLIERVNNRMKKSQSK